MLVYHARTISIVRALSASLCNLKPLGVAEPAERFLTPPLSRSRIPADLLWQVRRKDGRVRLLRHAVFEGGTLTYDLLSLVQVFLSEVAFNPRISLHLTTVGSHLLSHKTPRRWYVPPVNSASARRTSRSTCRSTRTMTDACLPAWATLKSSAVGTRGAFCGGITCDEMENPVLRRWIRKTTLLYSTQL